MTLFIEQCLNGLQFGLLLFMLAAGLTLVFVRVQRRPLGGNPPYQSPALRRYVRDLRAYIESHGATLIDDTGDPAETLDLYEDGDHLSRDGRRRYSERFAERVRRQFP